MPTILFHLPREIRDQIYRELWVATPHLVISQIGGIHLALSYDEPLPRKGIEGNDRSDISKLPRWLITNRAIMVEACAELTRHCTATVLFSDRLSKGTMNKRLPRNLLFSFRTQRELEIRLDKVYYGNLFGTQINNRLQLYDKNGLRSLLPRVVSSRVVKLLINIRVRETLNGANFLSLKPLRSVKMLERQLEQLTIEVEHDITGELAQSSFESSLANQIEITGKGFESMELSTSKTYGTNWHGRGVVWKFVFTRIRSCS
jgi:hypothetical protein